MHCLLRVSQGLWRSGNFKASLLHLHNAAMSAVQAVLESLGKLTRVPLFRPSTSGEKRAFFGQGLWRFWNFMIMVNPDSAERGFLKEKISKAERWLIQYQNSALIVYCMSQKSLKVWEFQSSSVALAQRWHVSSSSSLGKFGKTDQSVSLQT